MKEKFWFDCVCKQDRERERERVSENGLILINTKCTDATDVSGGISSRIKLLYLYKQ
jgi:hypothetical protein